MRRREEQVQTRGRLRELLPPPPAALGGAPAFPDGLPLAVPRIPNAAAVGEDVQRILASGVLTNGPYVRTLEERAAEYTGVRNCVAVSSCTAGLMLVLRAAQLTGDVVIPSFTFAATAHAVVWAGLRPVFADVDATLTLSPEAVEHATGVRASAVLATHTFGTPCDVEALAEIASNRGVRLFFDAAHALGSRRKGMPIGGFGNAEVFSLTPTKTVIAGEGGIVATNDDLLAEQLRIGRNYGNPGDYDCTFVGLNARMSEVHAAIALASLEDLDDRIEQRNHLANLYCEALSGIPGISFPEVAPEDRSTYKDFTILVDPSGFGLSATRLGQSLDAEGIETRRYYAPPVHTMKAYRGLVATNGSLPVTESAAERVLTLPLWVGMGEPEIERVASTIGRIGRSLGTFVAESETIRLEHAPLPPVSQL
ncbi:MAG: DegT/DnrJ/EryC1/StrS family aminotransferase [Actinomycetota bacterium]